jgi:hypothetical protein
MKLRHSFITSIVAGSLFCTLLTGVSPAMAAEASDVPTSTQDRLQELGAAAAEWVSVSDAQTA